MNEIKTVLKGIKSETIYKIGFWFLVIFLAGYNMGIYYAQSMIIERKLSDSMKLGAMVIDGKVFDLKERL